MTVLGPVKPADLGKVMMHEHLHSEIFKPNTDGELILEEKPATTERREYLLKNAVPHLKKAREKYGMGAYVDVSMPPWRAWPDVYADVSRASGVHIIMATGYYREIELGCYWASSPERQIWPYVRQASVEELTELCIRELTEGINGTKIRAGVVKLGSSQAPMTPTEKKAFRAGARAHLATGVHITTHCTILGAETSQLTILEDEGVDLSRVVVGHTHVQLMEKHYRNTVIEWMKRGANFLPTNMGVKDVKKSAKQWQPLVDGIQTVFDAGHGDKLLLGLDSGYCSESGTFEPMQFLPPHPWTHLWTNTLPAFRAMGLTRAQEKAMLETNPQRIVPVQ